MRRGKKFYEFDQLSGGMREQLTAALRLSMADVLKSEHNGCLPLVFDDAFTNSDPKRVEIVKKMLQSAVDKGLQVILLTCDPKAYEKFANKKEIYSNLKQILIKTQRFTLKHDSKLYFIYLPLCEVYNQAKFFEYLQADSGL
mgnify:CR=1 FL=1